MTTEITRDELTAAADDVSEWIDGLSDATNRSIDELRNACWAGEFGDKGRAAAAVLYAHQYDGIIGDCVTQWRSASSVGGETK